MARKTRAENVGSNSCSILPGKQGQRQRFSMCPGNSLCLNRLLSNSSIWQQRGRDSDGFGPMGATVSLGSSREIALQPAGWFSNTSSGLFAPQTARAVLLGCFVAVFVETCLAWAARCLAVGQNEVPKKKSSNGTMD